MARWLLALGVLLGQNAMGRERFDREWSTSFVQRCWPARVSVQRSSQMAETYSDGAMFRPSPCAQSDGGRTLCRFGLGAPAPSSVTQERTACIGWRSFW
jgi:hypothetical protein